MKKTILIVDDLDSLREKLTTAFSSVGWKVATASDGEEVFRKFASYKPDGILLDIYMPKIKGTEVCRLIKGHPVWRGTYLVIMSSRLSERDEQAYYQMGADAILEKPFNVDKAIQMFERAMSGKQQKEH